MSAPPHLEGVPAAGLSRVELAVAGGFVRADGSVAPAWYLKAFDDAGEILTRALGMGESYTAATGLSWVALESHLSYIEPVRAGDALEIASMVVGHDRRKLHVHQVMRRAGRAVAVHEQLGLHFDTRSRRAADFPAEIVARLAAWVEAAREPASAVRLGRRVALAAEP